MKGVKLTAFFCARMWHLIFTKSFFYFNPDLMVIWLFSPQKRQRSQITSSWKKLINLKIKLAVSASSRIQHAEVRKPQHAECRQSFCIAQHGIKSLHCRVIDEMLGLYLVLFLRIICDIYVIDKLHIFCQDVQEKNPWLPNRGSNFVYCVSIKSLHGIKLKLTRQSVFTINE